MGAGVMLSMSAGAFAASAGASFINTCLNGEEGDSPSICQTRNNSLIKQRVVVNITPDAAHVGKIGAVYIGLRTDGEPRGAFTPQGWTALNGGLFEPAVIHTAFPGGTQQFVVVDGTLLCPQLGGAISELWAGYGVLDDTGEMMVKNYKNSLSKSISYEHLVRTYVQREMTVNQRVWKVLEVDCTVRNSSSGGGSSSSFNRSESTN
jgi:hypothetical protein